MKRYTFIVREWNASFFVGLKSRIIENDTTATFQFLTMQHIAYEQMLDSELSGNEILYLPQFFDSIMSDRKKYLGIDDMLHAKYGFGINRLYDLERFKPERKDEVVDFKVKQTLGLAELFKEGSILVSLTMDHFVYVLCGFLNQSAGGDNFFIQPVGFPRNANAVFSNPWRLKKVKSNLKGKELEEFISSLKLKPEESIHYMKKTSEKKSSLLKRIEIKIKGLRSKKRAQKYHGLPFTYLDNQLKYLFNENHNKYTQAWYPSSLSFNQIREKCKNVKVFYFPLQLEPEMSTLAYSPFVRNQLEIVRLVSMTLREGDLLLLKENPKMKGQRKQSFYDEIEKYDNVMWASFEINSREIIRIAFKTISVTGTACIESACLGKPSMIFGFAPWSNHLEQEPFSNKPITQLYSELYADFSSEVIQNKLCDSFLIYKDSLLLANFIPLGENENWNCADLINTNFLIEETYKLLKEDLCAE